MARRRSGRRVQARKKGYRSAFEFEVAKAAEASTGKDLSEYYETHTLEWTPKIKKYCPDFVLPNGIIIEVKGRLTMADRVKHLAIKEQYPDQDVRFIFQYDNTLTKGSKTRYSDWCDKHEIPYAFNVIPKEWLQWD